MCLNSESCASCIGCVNFDLPNNAPKPIYSAFLIVTEACNLKCRYCFVQQSAKKMSLQTAIDTCKMLVKNAAEWNETHLEDERVGPLVTFFGGEPTLRWDDLIVPLVEYVKTNYANVGVSYSMTTNGILLTKERIQYLKENNFELLFSIDGAKETQDYNRLTYDGSSSFDKIKDVIPMILEAFPHTTFRSTIIPDTVHLTFENFKFAMDAGYTHFFHMPNHFEEWNEEEKLILAHQLKLIADYYIDCYRNDIPVGHSPIEQKLGEIITINRSITNNISKSGMKCGLGLQGFAAINVDGKIVSCQEMPSYPDEIFVIGDIYNGLDIKRVQDLYNLYRRTTVRGTNCDTCQLEPICTGGCIVNNYLKSKDFNQVTPIHCYWEQLLIKEAIRIMNTLGAEENISFKTKFFS